MKKPGAKATIPKRRRKRQVILNRGEGRKKGETTMKLEYFVVVPDEFSAGVRWIH